MPASEVAAVVLAGGKSTRLGRDKASEPLLGIPLLERVLDALAGLCGETVIVKAAGQKLPRFNRASGARVVQDLYPDAGPLGGLYTGLAAISAPAALVVACDTPLLQPLLLEELIRRAPGEEVVAPVLAGEAQPLCAVYAKSCLERIRRRLEAGDLRLRALLSDLRVLEVTESDWRAFDPEGLSFVNLNRAEDLVRAEALLHRAASARGQG